MHISHFESINAYIYKIYVYPTCKQRIIHEPDTQKNIYAYYTYNTSLIHIYYTYNLLYAYPTRKTAYNTRNVIRKSHTYPNNKRITFRVLYAVLRVGYAYNFRCIFLMYQGIYTLQLALIIYSVYYASNQLR